MVPPLNEVRKDCTYGALPGMQLPDAVQGVHSTMMDMERRCVYACYAGAIVHALEGWDHHEVSIPHICLFAQFFKHCFECACLLHPCVRSPCMMPSAFTCGKHCLIRVLFDV